jgi:hypothetical protein
MLMDIWMVEMLSIGSGLKYYSRGDDYVGILGRAIQKGNNRFSLENIKTLPSMRDNVNTSVAAGE